MATAKFNDKELVFFPTINEWVRIYKISEVNNEHFYSVSNRKLVISGKWYPPLPEQLLWSKEEYDAYKVMALLAGEEFEFR
jgi:hypothetical protein